MDCLLAGVGGQGIVLASRLLAQTALDMGFSAHTSETIGMAQRGGSVTSQVRIGEGPCAASIPHGKADLIIGFEPAEALRNVAYLREGGAVLVNVHPIQPVTSSLGGGYALREILSYLENKAPKIIKIDGRTLCRAAGSEKVFNVLVLGIAAAESLLPFEAEQMLKTLRAHVPEKFKDLNEKAFRIGMHYKDY